MAFTSLANFVQNNWMTWPSWLYFLEGLVIVIGNAVTIAVFWKRRNFVKRASFLLINLAVADLLLGVALLTSKVASLPRNETVRLLLFFTVFMFMCVGSAASVVSLTVIAMERALAVAKPLKHRAAPTSYYRGAIISVWLMAVLLATVLGLTISEWLNLRFLPPALAAVFLLIIILSYAVIWLYSTQRRMNKHIQANEQVQSKKLAKTLAIVTFLSLATWLPLQVFFVVTPIDDMFGSYGDLYVALLWLWYSNSLVNPFVYVLRMPGFRQEIKRTFHLWKLCQDRRDEIPMRNVSALGFGQEASNKPPGTRGGR